MLSKTEPLKATCSQATSPLSVVPMAHMARLSCTDVQLAQQFPVLPVGSFLEEPAQTNWSIVLCWVAGQYAWRHGTLTPLAPASACGRAALCIAIMLRDATEDG